MKNDELYHIESEAEWVERYEKFMTGEVMLTGTKKEMTRQAKELANKIKDEEAGSEQIYKRYSSLRRIKEFVDVLDKELKDSITDDQKEKSFHCYGMEFTKVEGRTSLNYADDHEWSELHSKLKEREELLKVAFRSENPIFDSNGIEVTKVSIKPTSDYITIKF